MSGLVAPCLTCGLHHSNTVMCPISQLLVGDARLTLAGGTVVARRYQIIDLLHQGPMSTVYRAADAGRSGESIVLKDLNLKALPPAEAAEAFTWFLREAHLLSTIRHCALPRLHASFFRHLDAVCDIVPKLDGFRSGRHTQCAGWSSGSSSGS